MLNMRRPRHFVTDSHKQMDKMFADSDAINTDVSCSNELLCPDKHVFSQHFFLFLKHEVPTRDLLRGHASYKWRMLTRTGLQFQVHG